MNSVNLIGRVTNDIEQKAAGATTVAKFTLAINRIKKEEADFINCTAWGKTAELLEKYVKKGDRLAVSGQIRVEGYEKEGKKIWYTSVNVSQIEFLQDKKTSNSDKTEEAKENDEFPF